MQPDPSDASYDVSDPQSMNRYSYVENDPVNFVDPTGLFDVRHNTRFGGEDSFGQFGPQFGDYGGSFDIYMKTTITLYDSHIQYVSTQFIGRMFFFPNLSSRNGNDGDTQDSSEALTRKQVESSSDPRASCIRSVESIHRMDVEALQKRDDEQAPEQLTKLTVLTLIGFIRGPLGATSAFFGYAANISISSGFELRKINRKYKDSLKGCGVELVTEGIYRVIK